MANQLVTDALRITRLSIPQKLVLLHLCDVANKEYGYEVWHSQVQIAHYQGLSERATRNALKALEELKLIRVSNRAGEMRGRNHYRVDVERVKRLGERDRVKAEEVIEEIHQRDRDRKAQARIRAEIKASLRVVEMPVENRESA